MDYRKKAVFCKIGFVDDVGDMKSKVKFFVNDDSEVVYGFVLHCYYGGEEWNFV